MKTLKLFAVMLILAFFVSSNRVNAQTFQKELIATFNDMYLPCIDIYISGTWTCHFTYQLDKGGKISRMHFNTLQSDFHEVQTGEKVICLDTGNDKLGNYFWFFNNPNAANGIEDCYNVKDGWLDQYMPDNYPFEEGSMVEQNWKFIYGGEKYGVSTLIQLHINAKGVVTVDNSKTKIICTE